MQSLCTIETEQLMKPKELENIMRWFDDYVRTFADDKETLHPLLQLKVDHSKRVARTTERLARDLNWEPAWIVSAQALGLLHDIGRFPQFAEFGTFSDTASVDHGEYGQTVAANAPIWSAVHYRERDRILTGIRYHNARRMPGHLAPYDLPLLKIIRDADKLDILNVVLNAVETNGFRDFLDMLPNVTLDRSCSPGFLRAIQDGHCCSLKDVQSLGDFLLMQLSWVHDFNYKPALRHFSRRRITSRILRQLPDNQHMKRVGSIVRALVANRLGNGTTFAPMTNKLNHAKKKGRQTMLDTNLKHLETEQEIKQVLENNGNVMICCGRMGPMCIPVYGIMEQLESQYSHVAFRDQDFDIPAADFIKNLPECASFMGLPFTVYFKKGKVVAATTSIQDRKQVTQILDREFGKPS